jgi:hypothetical protein
MCCDRNTEMQNKSACLSKPGAECVDELQGAKRISRYSKTLSAAKAVMLYVIEWELGRLE